jgi:hypothetical protein
MDLSQRDPKDFGRCVAQKAARREPPEATASAVFRLVVGSVASCAVCFVLQELEFYTMASLPLEIGRNSEVRRSLADEAPLCNYHAWYLCRLGSPADVVAFSAAWLERMVQAEEYRPGLRSAGELDPRLRRPRWLEDCPLCTLLRSQARELCEVLVALLEGPLPSESLPALRLCIPHFGDALEVATGALVRQRLVRAEAQGLTAAIEELAEAQRQYAGRSRHLGALWDAHLRGIQMCVGMPGTGGGPRAELNARAEKRRARRLS